jgi:hypothetical protein
MPVAPHVTLQTVSDVKAAISSGDRLFLAGSHAALSQLPRGQWIGGTIPYFMTETGGTLSEDRIFVTRIPSIAQSVRIADYGADSIQKIYHEAPENGFAFLVLPHATAVHKAFAEQAPTCDGFLFHPVVGWVAGVRADLIGRQTSAVFNGLTGAVHEDRCCALHVTLPVGHIADLDIVNIFEPDDGPVVSFEQTGFRASGCIIDGRRANLAEFICARGLSTEFPLVGDYSGTNINVSFQNVDPIAKSVDFYAPVFPGVDYRFAKPVSDYAKAFARTLASGDREPAFACNCILNYLYGGLEGKTTGSITGPITFGEIAHQLLNQTLVRMTIRSA